MIYASPFASSSPAPPKKNPAHLYSMRVMSAVQEHKIFALACVVLEEGRKGERGVGGAANIAPFFRE